MKASDEDERRSKKCVKFSTDISFINQLAISEEDNFQKWYDSDDIESFSKDAKMISRAFQVQLTRRRNDNKKHRKGSTIDSYIPSKTICTLGLEYKIDIGRQKRKIIATKSVLEIQEECKNCSFSEKEMRIAFVSCGATYTARYQAINSGRNTEEEQKKERDQQQMISSNDLNKTMIFGLGRRNNELVKSDENHKEVNNNNKFKYKYNIGGNFDFGKTTTPLMMVIRDAKGKCPSSAHSNAA